MSSMGRGRWKCHACKRMRKLASQYRDWLDWEDVWSTENNANYLDLTKHIHSVIKRKDISEKIVNQFLQDYEVPMEHQSI